MEVRKGFVSTGEIDVFSLKINLYFNTFYNGSDIVTRSFFKEIGSERGKLWLK